MPFISATNTFVPSLISKSEWKFKGFASGSLSIETPEVNVGISLMGGQLSLQRDSDANATNFTVVGAGGTVGLSLIPSPVNFTISTNSMPSTGIVYKTGWAGAKLTVDEIRGRFVMAEVAADWTVGGSCLAMFFGLSRFIPMSPDPIMLSAALASAEGIVFASGMTGTVLPVNAGATMYHGELI